MSPAILLLSSDCLAILSAVVAAWFWYRAGVRDLRRVSKDENLDFQDLNRMITVINRASIMNRRGAIASAISALCVAIRFVISAVVERF